MMKQTMTAAALVAVLAAPAFAQSNDTKSPAPSSSMPAQSTDSKPQATDSKMTAPSGTMPAQSATDTKTPATSTTAMNTPAKAGFIQNQQENDWRGSKVIGATVYGPDNASIGEVNDVLIGNDGKINAAVIGVGGFLGVGEKNVAIPFESLNITRKPDSSAIQKINVAFTKDQLKSAPTFAYYEPGKAAATTGSGVNNAKPMTPATTPAHTPAPATAPAKN